MGRKHYWEAVIWFAVSLIPGTAGVLSWNIHHRVSAGIVVWFLLCWVMAVLCVRRGRRAL